jgi:branched-subunit amino acid transport protein
MNLWPVMIVAGLGTFLTRLSFILLVGERPIPPVARRVLRYVPPAALTAIIAPELLMPAGHLDISLGNARLLAGLAAALVAWKTRSAVLTIVVGMVVLWGFTYFI